MINIWTGTYTHNLEITSNDPDNQLIQVPIKLTIEWSEPRISAIPNYTHTGWQLLEINLNQYVRNKDSGTSYNLSWTLSRWLTFNEYQGTILWIPTDKWVFNLSLTATKNNLVSNTQNFSITITWRPPIINEIWQKSFAVSSNIYLNQFGKFQLRLYDSISSLSVAIIYLFRLR